MNCEDFPQNFEISRIEVATKIKPETTQTYFN